MSHTVAGVVIAIVEPVHLKVGSEAYFGGVERRETALAQRRHQRIRTDLDSQPELVAGVVHDLYTPLQRLPFVTAAGVVLESE